MANPNPAPKHRFKPGQSGNPDGARKHDPIRRALKNALKSLTLESYRKIIEAACRGNLASLEQMILDPKLSALEVGIANSLFKAIKRGDQEVIEKLVSRIVGKIPDEVNVNATNLNLNAADVDIPPDAVKAAVKKLMLDV